MAFAWFVWQSESVISGGHSGGHSAGLHGLGSPGSGSPSWWLTTRTSGPSLECRSTRYAVRKLPGRIVSFWFVTGSVVSTSSRSVDGMSCQTTLYLHSPTQGAAAIRPYMRSLISSSATTGGHLAAWSWRPSSAMRSSPWQSSGEFGQTIPWRMFIDTMRRSSWGATRAALLAPAEAMGAAAATSTPATSTTSSFRTNSPRCGTLLRSDTRVRKRHSSSSGSNARGRLPGPARHRRRGAAGPGARPRRRPARGEPLRRVRQRPPYVRRRVGRAELDRRARGLGARGRGGGGRHDPGAGGRGGRRGGATPRGGGGPPPPGGRGGGRAPPPARPRGPGRG